MKVIGKRVVTLRPIKILQILQSRQQIKYIQIRFKTFTRKEKLFSKLEHHTFPSFCLFNLFGLVKCLFVNIFKKLLAKDR